MARVKDRLIFETKKMDAVAQRKSNKEQKLRSKEAQVNKQVEKAKKKRDHFKQLEEWAQSAAASRGKHLKDNDEMFLKSMNNEHPRKSEKRKLADKKYGFGGKRGRFKQNDPKEYDNLKGFNMKGNFPGIGTRNSSSSKTKNGAGANRKGKRARDASRGR
jgi:rRNA-processing protein EBP2